MTRDLRKIFMKLFIVISVIFLLLLGIISISLHSHQLSDQQIQNAENLDKTIPAPPIYITPTPTAQVVQNSPTGPMICYPAPVEGVLHPLYCGNPNMSAPYWCNLAPYPATTNPAHAVCGYKNQPDSVRQCLISFTSGSTNIVGYMTCF